MKKILNILASLVTGLAVMTSCSKGEKAELPLLEPTSRMSVEVDPGGNEENRVEIKTVRIIVFGKASTAPRLEANKLMEVKSSENTGTTIKVSDVEVLVGSDKIAFVIINEPHTGGLSMKQALDDVTTMGDLESMTYDIARLLNANGDGNITATSGMPMVGIKRDITVVAEELKNPGDNEVSMFVERAVAMVEIYLEPSAGVTTGYFAGTSKVTVKDVSHQSYFVMGNAQNGTRDNGLKNFGQVKQNIDPSELKNITWTASTPLQWDGTDPNKRKLLSRFYVAERIFRTDFSDRMTINMSGFKRNELTTAGTNGDQIITTIAGLDGVPVPFREFRRNNVYQITATVSELLTIDLSQITVKPWDKINVEVPEWN